MLFIVVWTELLITLIIFDKGTNGHKKTMSDEHRFFLIFIKVEKKIEKKSLFFCMMMNENKKEFYTFAVVKSFPKRETFLTGKAKKFSKTENF